MNRTKLAWLSLVLTTILWSSSLIFAKIVYDEVTPILFVALRYSIACPFLVALVLYHNRDVTSFSKARENWHLLFIAGITGPFLSQVLQYIGLSMTTAGETLLLLNMSPVFAVLLAAPMLKEKVTYDKIGALLLATFGAILIVADGISLDIFTSSLHFAGDIIVIASTLLFAINGIVGKKAVGSVDSISVTLYTTLFAVPFIWLSAIIFEDITSLIFISLTSWAAIIWVGTVNSVLAFILYYDSMKHIEASRVQIALSLIAVWGVLLSFFVLGEQITPIQIAGGIVTIAGVIVAQHAQVS